MLRAGFLLCERSAPMRFKKAYLEITNVCNLRCAFCPGTRRAPRFMTRDEFTTLAARLRPYTDYLYLHLMGEPLLHPELSDLLDAAGALGFRVIVTTNGTLLDERGGALIAAPAVHKVNVSLQSFEANTGGELNSYVNQCAVFAARMDAAGKLCVLRLWNENGLNALNPGIEDILAAHFPRPWRAARNSAGLAERVWLEPGEKFDWPDMAAGDGGERVFCYGLRDQIGVLADGTVVPCCLDHDGDLALGNLFHNSIDDIMSTDKARAIYDGFSARRAAEKLCRRCGYARRFG